jgi:AcrR family transcriptional regulator
MARIVDEQKYALKRNEILDAAQRLVYTKGYELMAIQDILDELQMSKGAFYHYFDSKQAMLEALIERMLDDAGRLLNPIVQDAHLPAMEKLNRFFAAAANWKIAQKAFFLALLRVWYQDENAIVRQKVYAAGVKWVAPMLSEITRQGVQEGIMTTAYPERTGEVVFSLFQGLGDTLSELLLSPERKPEDLRYGESTVAAYTDALERVLGAPEGSVEVIDAHTLHEWFSIGI